MKITNAEDWFEFRLDYLKSQKDPFIAYWHPTGRGFLKMVHENGKPRSQRVAQALRNKLIKLRKSNPYIDKILFVQFDGREMIREEI